jgi:hypothetical protein
MTDPRLFAESSEDNPDEALDIWMDGEVIMTVTYDQIGYSGIQLIQQLVEKIEQQL